MSNQLNAINKYDEKLVDNFYIAKKQKKSLREFTDFRISKFVEFKDEIWDFNYVNSNNRDRRKYRISFKNIPENFVFYIKMEVLNHLLTKKNTVDTCKKIASVCKNFTDILVKNNITDVRLIEKKFLENYCEEFKCSHKSSYASKVFLYIKNLIIMISDIENIDFSDIICYLNKEVSSQNALKPGTAVNEYIPDNFLDQLVSLAIQDIDNTNLTFNQRIFACLLVILAETGMRAEELTLLESNMLDTSKVKDKEINYLTFFTFKIKKYKSESKETYTYMSDNCTKAYRKCEEFVDQVINNLGEQAKMNLYYYLYTGKKCADKASPERKKLLSDLDNEIWENLNRKARKYLWINAKGGFLRRGVSVLSEHLKRFMIRHYEHLDINSIPNEQRKNIKFFSISTKSSYEKIFLVNERKKHSFDEIKTIKYPYVNPHMFRVTVCTKLFKNNVPLDFIMKHLNHLSEDMTAYYNKSHELINSLKEGIKVFSSITNSKGLIETDVSKINNDFMKKEMSNEETRLKVEKINKFLRANKLNIKTDINQIIKILEKTNTTIAENEFGICIRGVISGICERKEYFSSISDNYNIGIELSTYKFIDYNYKRFQQKLRIVEHNKQISEKDQRYRNEYQREVNALKGFVNKTIRAEIRLIEKDMKEKNTNYIIKKYPNLKDIIHNLDIIKKEIQPWIVK